MCLAGSLVRTDYTVFIDERRYNQFWSKGNAEETRHHGRGKYLEYHSFITCIDSGSFECVSGSLSTDLLPQSCTPHFIGEALHYIS